MVLEILGPSPGELLIMELIKNMVHTAYNAFTAMLHSIGQFNMQPAWQSIMIMMLHDSNIKALIS